MKLRHLIQLVFLVPIIVAVFVLRRNVEAWCPMGGVESLYEYFVRGTMLCSLAASNFFILIAVILLTIAFKRAFCGYLCPLGTIAGWMRLMAKKFGLRQIGISSSANKVLSLLKYAVLILILALTWHFATLVVHGVDPCYAVLSLGEEAKWTTYLSLAVFVVSAFFISMPFCRWLCPFAAVLNIFSSIGFTRIVRNPAACSDCNICSKSCPMGINVARGEQVKSADCISCMECLAICPAHQAKPLQWKLFGKLRVSNPHMVVFVGILLCTISAYLAAGLIPLPTFVYQRDNPVPDKIGICHLQIEGVKCSGTAKLFIYFLNRRDENQIPGYLKVSTSPASGYIDVTIRYDSSQTAEKAIKDAIIQPYYDEQDGRWRTSPFKILGYDLL